MRMRSLSHLDRNGRARMVDVSAKRPTHRQAQVQCEVCLTPEAFAKIQGGRLIKGDPFTVAKIAGIQAAKRTAEWIPLCHSLPLEHLEIQFELDARAHRVVVTAHAKTTAKTGIELEAFVAAAASAITLYDMVKAIDPAAVIHRLRLIRKSGGKEPFGLRAGSEIRCARRL